MSEDPVKPFREIQEKIGEETRTKVGERIYTWSEHYNNWIDMIQPILRNTSKEEQQNSMVIVRLLDLNYDLLWIMTNVIYNAAYHQIIRELRFVLDSMAQALYLDTEHPDADIYCKMEIVKEIEKDLFGSRLIERLPIQHKDKAKQLYSLLSKYSHSSYKELEPAIIQGKVDYRITPTLKRFDNKDLRERIKSLTAEEAKKAGIDKSTLYTLRQHVREERPFRLYGKVKAKLHAMTFQC